MSDKTSDKTADDQQALAIYLHLARASEMRRRPLVRDKLLVLAGVLAAETGLLRIGECCRQKVVARNPGHLLGHYPSLAAALVDQRFQQYLRQLRRNYSREKAEHLLESLGIDIERDRAAYFDDYEYAASLLGTTPEALDAQGSPHAPREESKVALASADGIRGLKPTLQEITNAPSEGSSATHGKPEVRPALSNQRRLMAGAVVFVVLAVVVLYILTLTNR